MRNIRHSVFDTTLIHCAANQIPLSSIGVTQGLALSVFKTPIKRPLVDDELIVRRTRKPTSGVHRLLLVFAPAGMTEMHNGPLHLQEVLLLEGDESKWRTHARNLLHTIDEGAA